MRFSKTPKSNTTDLTGTFSQTLAAAGQPQMKSKDPSDWKKVLLIAGLGTLSWISTYTGMLELIQANMGEIGLIYKGAIAFAVAMLMLMIIWLLDSLFSRLSLPVRVLFTAGYIFLTLISIGFGFGFYWKYLESRSEATRSASSAVENVQTALLSAQTRLEQLQVTLATLTSLSIRKAQEERETGKSCPNSRPGDGPRRRLRDADAKTFQYAGDFISTRVGGVKNDITVLAKDLKLVSGRHSSTIDAKTGTRNQFLRGLNQKLNNSVTRFNAFKTDPQLQQFRNSFAERSTQTIFPNGKGGKFTCPDPQLQAALRGVVLAIDQLPDLEKPRVAAVEGSEAIIEAFRRMTVTILGAITFKMPPSPDELRAMQQRAVQSVENAALQRQIMSRQAGLASRDYIPLSIAVFVDFCLLLVSMARPIHGFRALEKKMFEAEEWPIIQILARFKDIHADEDIRETFDIFRHVVFDYMGDYYVGVPLRAPLDAPDREDAQREAHLLANLFTSFEKEGIFKRVVWPNNAIARNRLIKQDSKFAGSDAFRIYRFRDGAWSDWVLGAIMGAAKRIETEKQRMKLEEQLFPSQQPAFENPNQPDSQDEPADERGPVRSNGHPAHAGPQHGGAGYQFDHTGYTNVEPLHPAYNKRHTSAGSTPHGDAPHGNGAAYNDNQFKNGQAAQGHDLHSEYRANGTDGQNGELNNRLRAASANTDANTGANTGATPVASFADAAKSRETTEVHSLWIDEPNNDVVQLSDASSYIHNPQPAQDDQSLVEEFPPTQPLKNVSETQNNIESHEHSNAGGTIRLKRETVEIDPSAVSAIKGGAAGTDFMSALTDALNPANIDENANQPAIEKIQTPEMPLIDQAPAPVITKPVDAYIHHELPTEPQQAVPSMEFDNSPRSEEFVYDQTSTNDPIDIEYEDDWEEDLQIENITRWYSRQDNDPKSS